jgi:site-specific DNA-methyltransferase (adenine-specific)
MNIIVNKMTTAIACINTNRNYIGFELDKHYCDIANERVQKSLAEKEAQYD